ANEDAKASQFPRRGESVLVGHVVAEKYRSRSAERRQPHERMDRACLVGARPDELDHALAGLHVKAVKRGQLLGVVEPALFEMRCGAAMQRRAVGLLFEQETMFVGESPQSGADFRRQQL